MFANPEVPRVLGIQQVPHFLVVDLWTELVGLLTLNTSEQEIDFNIRDFDCKAEVWICLFFRFHPIE